MSSVESKRNGFQTNLSKLDQKQLLSLLGEDYLTMSLTLDGSDTKVDGAGRANLR